MSSRRSCSLTAEFLRRKPPPPALYAAHRHLKVISKMESRLYCDPVGPNRMEFGALLADLAGAHRPPMRHRLLSVLPPPSTVVPCYPFYFQQARLDQRNPSFLLNTTHPNRNQRPRLNQYSVDPCAETVDPVHGSMVLYHQFLFRKTILKTLEYRGV